MSIAITAAATSFPERVVDNSFFGEEVQSTTSPMFLGTQYRRHIASGHQAADLIAAAVIKLMAEQGLDPQKDVDILMTNVAVPDEMFTGCGAVVVKKTGLKTPWIYDLHNTGCVSFLFMMDLADSIMTAHGAKSALICTAQTAAGRIFAHQNTRKKAQAAIPGDGCGVVYLTKSGPGKVLASALENFSECAEDMYMTYDDGRKYWEPGMSAGYIDFDEAKVARVIGRGNRLVPAMVKKVCAQAGVAVRDLSYLITNQPNLHFLRNWREALQLREDQHLHSFERYANLFGAGIPITLAENLAAGKIKPGDLVCLAGFSHAGDYAGASLLSWT